MRKGLVERVEWDTCVPARLTLNNVVIEAAVRFRWIISVQCVFRRHFDIPPRGHVHDRKCVLMRMDAFRATGNDSEERKGPPKAVRTPENVERDRVAIQTGI
ncbi:hypothetical protein TNCV_3426691 [Trichonephila clavipes]|nr:hypothetical protein TNCV_3426691 [Trichonephila clavipes]